MIMSATASAFISEVCEFIR